MFRDHMGLTRRGYAEPVRARRLHAALANGDRVVDALVEAGCRWKRRVYEEIGSLLGVPPSAA
jgi:AraC family transcriptional regulator of adaptative response/methylated-DNA-[protein]-cysteine methyltransferase